MGSSTQKQTVQAKTGPWAPTEGALTGAIPQIEQQYQQDKGGNLMPQASNYLSGVIGGDYLNPSSNPHLGALTKAVMDPIQAQLSAQFSRAGRGNSGDAARYISQGMTSGLAAPLFQQYNTERGLQQGAAAMAPGMDAAGSQALDQYLQRLGALGSAFKETSSTGTQTTTPSLGQTLGGLGMMGIDLMGGGGMGSVLGGLFGRNPNPFGLDMGLNDWGAGTTLR